MSIVKLVALLVIMGALAVVVLVYAATKDVLGELRRNPQRWRIVWVALLGLVALGVLVEVLKRLFL
jgi:RsiW-degrading membrane proteinase PrsW (M82 family)